MSSSSSSSSSSAALATVTVTARDIEFSDYNSATGKWESAVMTMMIEDTNTPDNINLEVYSEKVYAVFRNHDDPTDLVEFSPEVDGMDFRVTTSDPMVPSAKYELYKVYGETSGGEYATSSQFYFQVPGKVWDFANDIVDHDIELVSDWFNYGHVVTSDGVVHGFPTLDDAWNAASANSDDSEVVVNGETINNNTIIGYKLTSLATDQSSKPYFLSRAVALEDFDIVSSKITSTSGIRDYCVGPENWKVFNKRFAFPETLTHLRGFFSTPYNFNQPIYIPDSVTRLTSFFSNGEYEKNNYTAKVRMSPNATERYGSNFFGMTKWAGSFENMSTNMQLPDAQNDHPYVFGFISDWGKGLTNGTWTAPSTWTYIPSYWMYGDHGSPSSSGKQFTPYSVIIPEGITAIHHHSLANTTITSIKLPSTLETIADNTFSCLGGNTASDYLKLDMSECTNITELPEGFLAPCRINVSELKLPPNLTTIRNNFFHADFKGGYSLYTNWPVNEDNEKYFEIPEGVTSLGSNCCGGVITSKAKLILPSTLASVGAGFCYVYVNSATTAAELDLSQFSPEMFAESTQSFSCHADLNYQAYWKITVAPGTAEGWAERFPNISREYNGGTYWTRHIEWVEKPTQYAYVFYETNYIDDTPTKGYVELQSMADFNKLVNGPNAVSDAAITVDTDDQGNTIELHFGTASRSSQATSINTITGVHVGTDITAIPDHFLRSYKYLKKFKWGGNETSIGSYFAYLAGLSLKASDRPGNYDLANTPDTVTTIGQSFFYNSAINEEVHIPDSVTTISDFLSSCRWFNQPITIPDSVTTISSFLFSCGSFNQPITIPDSVTTISSFLYNCSSFNQPITIPDSVTHLSYFLYGCSSFNQPITIPDSVTSLSDFLTRCTSFNQPVSVNNTTSISGFLSGCIAFNSTVTVNNVGSHSGKQTTGFLSGCSAFNKPLDLSPFQGSNQFEVLGEAIVSYSPVTMASCSSFNSQLILPTSVRNGKILYNGSAFNQPITLPNFTESSGIYSNMCYGWKSFNQPITIPESWCKTRWFNDATLFEDCDSLTSTVTFSSSTVPDGTDTAVLYKSFSTTDSTAPCYTTGVTFTGTGAQAWKNVLPDSTTSPYRKINVV